MIRLGQLVLLSALGMAPAIVTGEEPPDDTIVEQIIKDVGFQPLSFAEDTEEIRKDIEDLLKAKWLVEEERLRRSDARVLKKTERYEGVSSLPEYERYFEVLEINVRGEPRLYSRQLPSDEAKRREAEASGVSPEQMAQLLRGYAAGAVATGEALRAELHNSPAGSLIAGLGFGLTADDIFDLPSGEYSCEDVLFGIDSDPDVYGIAGVESESVSKNIDEELEVQPYTSLNPLTLMTGAACMALVTADAFEAIDELDEEDKQQMADAMERALAEIRFSKMEQVNGRQCYRLRIDDANLVQPLDATLRPEKRHGLAGPGQSLANERYTHDSVDRQLLIRPASSVGNSAERTPYEWHRMAPAVFYYDADARSSRQPLVRQVQAESRGSAGAGTVAINTIDLWIDAEYLVDRKLRMFGVMTENGESHEIFIEQEWQDYRNVPDSALYEPYKRVMRVGGMQTEAQQAELAEARAQLDELERQMASMPADQRAMMEGMMGGQIEQMRNVVSGRAVEMEVITTSIEINPDFRNPMLEQFARENMAAPANVEPGGNLLQTVQVDLTTLGYEPGNTNGVLDTMTQVAISQFQAENGLQVTGEPSTELANALTAAVAER